MAAQRLAAAGEDDARLGAVGHRDQHRGGMQPLAGPERDAVADQQVRRAAAAGIERAA